MIGTRINVTENEANRLDQYTGVIGGAVSLSTPFCTCYDTNGNITDYVHTNVSIATHYDYSTFGRAVLATGPNPDDSKFRFSSKYLDAETGLYYYGLRYYNSAIGRWNSMDPIGEWGGLLLYGFVGNEPVGRWDLLGQRITVSAEKEEGFEYVLKIKATIQVAYCETPPPEEEVVKNAIEKIWTQEITYKETVRVGSGAGYWFQDIENKVRIVTEVDIKYVSKGGKLDKDRHIFYLSDEEGDDKKRSNAELRGARSTILKGDHKNKRVYAHEFGHWLSLIDQYVEHTEWNDKHERVRVAHGDKYNIMGLMTDGLHIYKDQLDELRDNRGLINKNLPLSEAK